jgi:hypothetical protein
LLTVSTARRRIAQHPLAHLNEGVSTQIEHPLGRAGAIGDPTSEVLPRDAYDPPGDVAAAGLAKRDPPGSTFDDGLRLGFIDAENL